MEYTYDKMSASRTYPDKKVERKQRVMGPRSYKAIFESGQGSLTVEQKPT